MFSLLIETTGVEGSLGLCSLSFGEKGDSSHEHCHSRENGNLVKQCVDPSRLTNPHKGEHEHCHSREKHCHSREKHCHSRENGNLVLKLLHVQKWEKPLHSAFVTSALESLMKEYQKNSQGGSIKSMDWKFIALGVGPGRFTGVRVGVSFAKTLSFMLNAPVYPVSSLKILAESQSEQEKPIVVLMNAFKNSLYMAVYQKKEGKLLELVHPCVVLPQELDKKVPKGDCVCVGDGYFVYESFFSAEFKKRMQVKKDTPFPEVKYLFQFLEREGDFSELISWKKLEPVYLRSPVRLLS